MKENPRTRILGLVGQRGSGKTSLLIGLVHELQIQKLQIAGIMSPGIFEGERKIAIEMIDLISGEGRLLAVLRDQEETGLQFGDWSFFAETLVWANQRLQAAPECDLLILDEIGPLELDFGKGLQHGLARMSAGEHKLGLISLRPRCAEAVQRYFPEIKLYYLETIGPEAIKETVIRIACEL